MTSVDASVGDQFLPMECRAMLSGPEYEREAPSPAWIAGQGCLDKSYWLLIVALVGFRLSADAGRDGAV